MEPAPWVTWHATSWISVTGPCSREDGSRLAPRSVIAKQQGATELSPPINSVLTWDFGPSQYSSKDGFKFHWYDGYVDAHFDRDSWQLIKNSKDYNHPSDDVLDGEDFSKFGSVIVGERGKLFFNRSRNTWVLKSSSGIDGFEWPDQSLPRATDQNNYREWLDAIEGKIDQGASNFGLAGPMTETILLGVLAQRNPDTRLKWNSRTMEVQGRPDLKEAHPAGIPRWLEADGVVCAPSQPPPLIHVSDPLCSTRQTSPVGKKRKDYHYLDGCFDDSQL